MQRGLGKPVRCGGSPRCRNWRGLPHERYPKVYPLGLHQEAIALFIKIKKAVSYSIEWGFEPMFSLELRAS